MSESTSARNVAIICPRTGGALFYARNATGAEEETLRGMARHEGLAVRIVEREELERLIAVYLAGEGGWTS